MVQGQPELRETLSLRISWHRIAHTSSSQSKHHDFAIPVYIFLLFFSFSQRQSPAENAWVPSTLTPSGRWFLLCQTITRRQLLRKFLLRKCYLHLGPHFSMAWGAGRKTVKGSSQRLVTLQECVEYLGLFCNGSLAPNSWVTSPSCGTPWGVP